MEDIAFQPRPNGRIFDSTTSHQNDTVLFPQLRVPPDYMPNGRKSLAGIAEHAFPLGIVMGLAAFAAGQLAYAQHYLWRLPMFVTTLAIFHFLEFDMTARYNPPDAKVSSFLLFNNGKAYNIAHTAAVAEILLRYWLSLHGYVSFRILPEALTANLPHIPFSISTFLGIFLILLGQSFRSLAMKEAGTSFNHVVQSSKKEDHVLVTTGVYRFCRHPAYFGFFWWGLGTQLVLGNVVCFVAYAAVLWKFFAHRVKHEEKHLVAFFGKDYEDYRSRTPVRIPFIV